MSEIKGKQISKTITDNLGNINIISVSYYFINICYNKFLLFQVFANEMKCNCEICSNHGKPSLKLFRFNDLHFSLYLIGQLIHSPFSGYSGNPQLILISLAHKIVRTRSKLSHRWQLGLLSFLCLTVSRSRCYLFTSLSKCRNLLRCFWETSRA